MTLTVRAASVTGATTASRALTHAEMDANWAHVIDSSNQTYTPSGSGAVAEAVSTALQRLPHSAQYGSAANFNTVADALTGTLGVSNLRLTGDTFTFTQDYTASITLSDFQGGNIVGRWAFNLTAHSDGTADPRCFEVDPVLSGANNWGGATGIICHMSCGQSGTVAAAAAFSGSPRVAGGGSLTQANAYNGSVHLISGAGNVTTGSVFRAKTQVMTGSGTITTLSALDVEDLGHATQVSNVYGMLVRNQTAAASLTAAVRSLVSAGSTKYFLYNDGGAKSYNTGDMTCWADTAIPAGGAQGKGYKFSSTADFGIFFGSGAPTLIAAKGSLYLRSDGSSTSTRAYINTDGSTTWTAITTAA